MARGLESAAWASEQLPKCRAGTHERPGQRAVVDHTITREQLYDVVITPVIDAIGVLMYQVTDAVLVNEPLKGRSLISDHDLSSVSHAAVDVDHAFGFARRNSLAPLTPSQTSLRALFSKRNSSSDTVTAAEVVVFMARAVDRGVIDRPCPSRTVPSSESR
jgi:hypothetical protein